MTLSDPLDIPNILTALPHRYPWVMVDRVTALTPGQRILGYKLVSHNEPWVPAHFPGRPLLPGVLVLEALAQLGGILAQCSTSEELRADLMYFLGIDKARFRRPVVPGDRLDLAIEVIHRRENVWKFRGEARVDGALAAQAELMASSASSSNPHLNP